MLHHRWPGNIRELENVMERVVTLESSNQIQVNTLPPEMVVAARKAAGIPREFTLRSNFIMGPMDLEKVLQEVRDFYKREAMLYTKNDEEAAKKLLGQ